MENENESDERDDARDRKTAGEGEEALSSLPPPLPPRSSMAARQSSRRRTSVPAPLPSVGRASCRRCGQGRYWRAGPAAEGPLRPGPVEGSFCCCAQAAHSESAAEFGAESMLLNPPGKI